MTKHRKKRLEAHVNVSFLKFTFLSLISDGCSVDRGILGSENTRRRKIERPVIEKREKRGSLFLKEYHVVL